MRPNRVWVVEETLSGVAGASVELPVTGTHRPTRVRMLFVCV